MILMYHHVCPEHETPPPSGRVSLEGWEYRISPRLFERQLRTVSRKGWRFVSLADYVDALRETGEAAPRTVAVTFDDGWRDNHDHALPVLRRLGIPATFFVVSGEMDGVPSSRRMDVGMLRAMQAAGMEIGGHSRTHPNLASLSEERLDEEIRGCRDDLASLLGRAPRFFAYPGGRHDARVLDSCRRAGYEAACSVAPWGVNDSSCLFHLHRDVLGGRGAWWRDRMVLSPRGRRVCRALRSSR